MDTLKDVPFVVDFAGANHVENLHENKGGKNKCQVARGSDFCEFLVAVEVLSFPI